MEKQLFKDLETDIIRCMKCGNCREVCPVFIELQGESAVARGKISLIEAVAEGLIEPSPTFIDLIFQCLNCGGCAINCPSGVEPDKMILAARAELIDRGMSPPELQENLRENLLKESNPFGLARGERADWLPEKYRKPRPSEYLYHLGCMVSYSSNRIARSIIRILDNIDFDFTIMGDDETCCGDPMFRVGDVKGGKRMIEENIRKFDKYGVKTIFSSCAGCINTFRARYPDRFSFIHITQLFDQLLQEGSLKFNKGLKKKIIYFDGCDLGRHSGIFEEPRNVLKAIPGVELLEYDANRDNAFCCGGPFMAGYPDLAKRIAARRIREAKEKGAEMIATSCPTCMVNLKEGAKVAGIEMEIMDIPMLLPKLLMKDSKKRRKGNEK